MRVVAAASMLSVAFLLLAATVPAQHATPDLFAAQKQARVNGRFHMLLRQFRAEEPTLAEFHEAGAKPATPVYQDARDIPAGFWVWQRPYWFVFRDGPDTAPQQRPWGPEAACGAPDTAEPGDHGTAWAMHAEDQKDEWLLLEYDAPVRVAAIEVHETCNPGALAAVAILTPQGDELELWSNRAVKAAAEKGRVLQIDLPLGFQVERVKLYFRSDAVPGFNEVDAVGLKDDKGVMHWASRAEASSTWADEAPNAGPPGGGGAFAVNRVFVLQGVQRGNFQVNLQLPRVVLQAPQLQVQQLQAWQLPRQPDAEKQKLLQRIAELEAKVKALEAELARSKARQ